MSPMFKYILIFALCASVHSQRTKDKMYDEVDGISACFRRLNGTHQIGCSSKRDGSTGVIHFVDSPSDLNFVLDVKNGLDYIPVIPIELFTRELNSKLQLLDHISGLLVYNIENEQKLPVNHYSPDLKCPNEGSNIQGTCDTKWNFFGNSLLAEDFKFPVFYLDKEKEVKKVRDCFGKFNNFSFDEHTSRSLCSIELQSFMFAAYDTPTCLRRSQSVVNMNPMKFCDALGDQNVWASLFPIGNSTLSPAVVLKSNIKQILVVSRIDATSLFYNLEPGAQSAVTGMVTLLGVAELLKRMLPTYEDYDRNVVFILFNGESFDYIGSQRIVYDMKKGEFPRSEYTSTTEHSNPIRFEDIDTVFEISQITNTPKLHLHLLNEPEQSEFLNILKKNLLNIEIHTDTIPPTSIQSFIREKNAPKSLVLTDYATNFTNAYYNSIYDNSNNIKFVYQNITNGDDVDTLPKDSIQVFIGGVVDGIAKTLYEAVTKREYKGTERYNKYYINELLHCYLESANCSIHRALRKGSFQPVPLSLYVGVTVSSNIMTNLLALTFAFFMGDTIGKGACPANMSSHVYYHFNMSQSVLQRNETQCYRISMNLTDAESPAFLIDGYDWTSGEYSSWTESVWREFNVRLFLKPARAHEIMTLVVGLVVFLASMAITLCINRKKDVLFENITTTTPPANC
ncbi:nicastrin-like isoform X1 [Atheta coriaria]|uniref:nicastrin-like isoform X1 n=1 Tax=Dalotia coriaria TaxID=877792 RepID=UPI0031F35EBC